MSAASARPFRLRRDSSLSTCVSPFAHGVLREPLQVQVERRVDVDGFGRRRRQARILFVERLADEVDEVRRFGLERALRRPASGSLRGAVGGVLRR